MAREILYGTCVARQVMHLCTGRSATFQNRRSVESIVAAVVAEKLVRNALSSSALAPSSDTIRIATESFSVPLDSTKRHSLIAKTGIARSFSKKLRRLHKAIDVETVVRRNSDNRLAHILTDFDDPGEIILWISH